MDALSSCNTPDGKYAIFSLNNGLAVVEAVTGTREAVWNQDGVTVLNVTACLFHSDIYLICAIDDMGKGTVDDSCVRSLDILHSSLTVRQFPQEKEKRTEMRGPSEINANVAFHAYVFAGYGRLFSFTNGAILLMQTLNEVSQFNPTVGILLLGPKLNVALMSMFVSVLRLFFMTFSGPIKKKSRNQI